MNLSDKTVLNILAKSSEAFLLLISSVVMVRHLSKADYGIFLQVMLIVNTAIMFTSLGLPQSIFYFYHKVRNRSHFIIQNLLLSLFIGSVTAILVYLLKNELGRWMNNPRLSDFGRIFLLSVFFRAPSFFREPVLLSHEALILNSLLTLACNLIIYVPLITAALLSATLEMLLEIMIISYGTEFCLSIGSMFQVFRQTRAHQNNSAHDSQAITISLKEQLIYALPIGASTYLGIIGRQTDQYIVSVFFTPKDYAVYSRGAMRIPVLSSIQYTVNDIMMPKYVNAYKNGDTDTFLKCFHQCIEKVAKVNFPAFSFLFATVPSLVVFLYTEEYIGASDILRVYLFLLVTGITVYGIIPRASGKTSVIMHAVIISISANILLSLVLISEFGPIGAAVATIVSSVISFYYYLFQSCRILGVRFVKIFPWSFLARLLAVTLIASIPVYCVNYFWEPKGLEILFALMVNGVLFLYCCIVLMMRQGLIYAEDMELLQRWLRFDVRRVFRKISFLQTSG